MRVAASHSRLEVDSGPPQEEVTARVREGQRKMERFMLRWKWWRRSSGEYTPFPTFDCEEAILFSLSFPYCIISFTLPIPTSFLNLLSRLCDKI